MESRAPAGNRLLECWNAGLAAALAWQRLWLKVLFGPR